MYMPCALEVPGKACHFLDLQWEGSFKTSNAIKISLAFIEFSTCFDFYILSWSCNKIAYFIFILVTDHWITTWISVCKGLTVYAWLIKFHVCLLASIMLHFVPNIPNILILVLQGICTIYLYFYVLLLHCIPLIGLFMFYCMSHNTTFLSLGFAKCSFAASGNNTLNISRVIKLLYLPRVYFIFIHLSATTF